MLAPRHFHIKVEQAKITDCRKTILSIFPYPRLSARLAISSHFFRARVVKHTRALDIPARNCRISRLIERGVCLRLCARVRCAIVADYELVRAESAPRVIKGLISNFIRELPLEKSPNGGIKNAVWDFLVRCARVKNPWIWPRKG